MRVGTEMTGVGIDAAVHSEGAFTSGAAVDQTHTLLSVLGTNPRPARYTLSRQETEARLAPIALFELLPETERFDRVMALCTEEAKRHSWPLLVDGLRGKCDVQSIVVPAGDTQEDLNAFLASATGAIPEQAVLSVDLTHGFRHFSFLTYIAVLYLAALSGVKIRGAYYGMLNELPKLSPFLDLRPLLHLPGWINALEVLRDTGSPLPMARILEAGPASPLARDSVRELTHLSEAYLSGLPLEFGWQAWNMRERRRKPLSKLLRRDHRLPLADNLIDGLAENLAPFALATPPGGVSWKKGIRISKAELQRQARIIDSLLDRGSFATAFSLMREWLVSWVVCRRTPEQDWLSRTVRGEAESLLHAVKAISVDSELRNALTPEQHKIGVFWGDLGEVRNGYAHQGMRGDDLVRGPNTAAARRRVVEVWKETISMCPHIDLSIGETPGDVVLVSPMGLRPGVLFSAVQACRAHGDRVDPALCLVICSPQSEGSIPIALRRADYGGLVESLLLNDAIGGGAEAICRLARTARKHFIGASRILVNVTGGTTLMGLAAEELATAARSLACPVQRFGLIDRRPPEHQDADPYQAGEPFWLDAGENANAN